MQFNKALAALQTSMGKIPHAKAVWIGTRADMPDHPFEKMLNGGVEYSQVHSTPWTDPPRFRNAAGRKRIRACGICPTWRRRSARKPSGPRKTRWPSPASGPCG